ncbi:glycosyl hydrolase family 28-related protein [Oleiharenicola lentus]|uniref:glycosyl hydrolase family 28-related protein n=1 Tax=Oleiharenicola lentus TaxID=2508720 RepID=UPI003F66253F
MPRRLPVLLCLLLALSLGVINGWAVASAPSVFPQRPADERALEFSRPHFEVHADGQGDDAPALQAAIDRIHATPEKRGIIFVPSGTYRLGRTVNVWRGVRLIGYGATRPVFLLGANTTGFNGPETRPLFFFAWDPPKNGEALREAGASGFFSAIINADIEVASGNPSAVGMQFHVAQHSFLAHMEFRLGDAKAGIEDIGNLIRDCRFLGGQHAIIARRSAPTWPFVILDSAFSGQTVSSITTEEAGLIIVRAEFSDVPKAIEVNANRPEQLWLRDSVLTRISGPAITISDSASLLSQTNFVNVAAEDVPTLLVLRETGEKTIAPGKRYVVADFTHGWQKSSVGVDAKWETISKITAVDTLPARVPTDVAPLPAMNTWVNARDLGARGDGTTDDTAALQHGLREHAAVYLPSGHYVISDTLRLRADGALFGLHASTTRLVAKAAAPAFEKEGDATPMIATAKGGAAMVSGFAIDTGVSPRVIGIEWRAGKDSLVDDLCFVSLHSHRGERPEAELPKYWDTQGHSLWVKDGGGGTFLNVWTASQTARSGLYISDTQTPGRVYVMSSEHHLHREVRLDRVANWEFYALQTEAEGDEGVNALQFEVNDSHNLLFANLFMYRVSRTRTPYPEAMRFTNSRAVEIRGLHLYSPTKFAYDRAVFDATSGRQEFARDLARLSVGSRSPETASARASLETSVKLLVSGLENIDGVAVRPDGGLNFIHGREGRIYEWTPKTGVRFVAESPVRPASLAVDPQSGALLVIARGGTVYRLKNSSENGETFEPLVRGPRADFARKPWLRATSLFGPNNDFVETAARPVTEGWTADSVVLPITALPVTERPHPWIMNAAWRAYGLKVATPGGHFYLADEFRRKTYRFKVNADGSLVDATLFAEVGEADIAVGADGRVYIAAGEIFVFDAAGKRLGAIKLPERPTSLALSPDGKTLYVGARGSLFAVALEDTR